MKAKSYLDSKIEVTKFVLPEHLNNMGNMHGGEIMKLMDDTAGLSFIKHANGKAVTAAANDIRFIKSIPSNSVVKCITQLVGTGNTSMQVIAQVFIENVEDGSSILAADGVFIGVAVDDEGKPRSVAPVITEKKRALCDSKEKEA